MGASSMGIHLKINNVQLSVDEVRTMVVPEMLSLFVFVEPTPVEVSELE